MLASHFLNQWWLLINRALLPQQCNKPSYWYGSSCKQLYPHRPQWASYQIRKVASCACAGNAWNASLPPRVRDLDISCMTHVQWCKSGSLTSGFLCRWRHSRRMRNPQLYVYGKRPMKVEGSTQSPWGTPSGTHSRMIKPSLSLNKIANYVALQNRAKWIISFQWESIPCKNQITPLLTVIFLPSN